MIKCELYHSLDYVNHSREKRMEIAQFILDNPELVKTLVTIVFKEDMPVSPKAAWALEFVTRQKLSLVFPVIDNFTENIGKLTIESSIRPAAKICEDLVLSYFSDTPNESQDILKIKHLERITATCFDWLIGDHKVAPKAYSITSLFQLGKKFDWVHPELKIILEQNYNTGSAAYKARARMTLKKMSKFKT